MIAHDSRQRSLDCTSRGGQLQGTLAQVIKMLQQLALCHLHSNVTPAIGHATALRKFVVYVAKLAITPKLDHMDGKNDTQVDAVARLECQLVSWHQIVAGTRTWQESAGRARRLGKDRRKYF